MRFRDELSRGSAGRDARERFICDDALGDELSRGSSAAPAETLARVPPMPPHGASWATVDRVRWSEDGKIRLCGTPGCTFKDRHDGPCSNAVPLTKRPRVSLPAPQPKHREKLPSKRKQRERKPAAKKDDDDLLSLVPAEQAERPDGLRKYYHVHRWGTPLEDGPVAAVAGGASDDEMDEGWRLDESTSRVRTRPEVSAEDADFIAAWNAHVKSLTTRLVSDRMLPEACRTFAVARASELRAGAPLHRSFRAHLRVMWEHNLLHRDDVQDCLGLLEEEEEAAAAPLRCPDCARPLHEPHCALAARARGAAAWPSGSNFKEATDHERTLFAASLLPGGVWEEHREAELAGLHSGSRLALRSG